MKTADKFERVASLAIWSHDAVIQGYSAAPSAYTIAKVATDLQRLSTTMKRHCLVIINGGSGDGDRFTRETAIAFSKKARLKTLDKARKVASSIGLTCDESEDGMGYLEIFRPGNDETPIAVF